ncbi:hypothetical protein Hdeb2414_s0010g00349621 [Helianthus debilis subsp. tardiflorus]
MRSYSPYLYFVICISKFTIIHIPSNGLSWSPSHFPTYNKLLKHLVIFFQTSLLLLFAELVEQKMFYYAIFHSFSFHFNSFFCFFWPARHFVKNRRPNRPDPGSTPGSMLKQPN